MKEKPEDIDHQGENQKQKQNQKQKSKQKQKQRQKQKPRYPNKRKDNQKNWSHNSKYQLHQRKDRKREYYNNNYNTHNNQNHKNHRFQKKQYKQNKPFHKAQYNNQTFKVNRRQKCPFLVRIIYAINDQNTVNNLNQIKQLNRQIHLHLWKDSTLREITELLRAHLPQVRSKQKFAYTKISISPQNKELIKEDMGVIVMHKRYENHEDKSLYNYRFNIGDMIDVSITYK